MPQSILSELGFSPNEAKIYEALLDLKEAGVGEISLKAEVHRRNVYDALNRLIDKGLVFPIMAKGENLYSPVDPDKLLEIIREKEAELNKSLPHLRERYHRKTVSQEAYIYRGVEGFKNYMLDMVREGKDVYVIGAKLSWLDPVIKNFSERILKEMGRKKISFHILFDEKVKGSSADISTFGKNHRFLPAKYLTDSTINIFGDYVVTYTGLYEKKIDEKGTLFVLKDAQLAESYRAWFQFMWDKCR
jgi:sugar-specific transcriptional regulator TrmB